MNFFDAKIVKNGGAYAAEFMGTSVALSQDVQKTLVSEGAGERDVIVGVRPEHITLSENEGIEAVVDVSEMMGSEIYLHVDVKGKDVVIRIPTTELPAKYRGGIPSGERIRFRFDAALAHIFDKTTERNLATEL